MGVWWLPRYSDSILIVLLGRQRQSWKIKRDVRPYLPGDQFDAVTVPLNRQIQEDLILPGKEFSDWLLGSANQGPETYVCYFRDKYKETMENRAETFDESNPDNRKSGKYLSCFCLCRGCWLIKYESCHFQTVLIHVMVHWSLVQI